MLTFDEKVFIKNAKLNDIPAHRKNNGFILQRGKENHGKE